jgi:hypothetical protein
LALDGSNRLVDHTGGGVSELRGAWLDEDGNLLLLSERGIGLLCDRDLHSVADNFCLAGDAVCAEDDFARLIAAGADSQAERIFFKWSDCRIELKTILRVDVRARFGFDPRPRPSDNNA